MSSPLVRLDVSIPRRLPERIEIAAYYLIAEALTDTAKHAHATTAAVTVAINRGRLWHRAARLRS